MLDLAPLVAELVTVHGVHTVILYGSYARGDATAAADATIEAIAALVEQVTAAR